MDKKIIVVSGMRKTAVAKVKIQEGTGKGQGDKIQGQARNAEGI